MGSRPGQLERNEYTHENDLVQPPKSRQEPFWLFHDSQESRNGGRVNWSLHFRSDKQLKLFHLINNFWRLLLSNKASLFTKTVPILFTILWLYKDFVSAHFPLYINLPVTCILLYYTFCGKIVYSTTILFFYSIFVVPLEFISYITKEPIMEINEVRGWWGGCCPNATLFSRIISFQSFCTLSWSHFMLSHY